MLSCIDGIEECTIYEQTTEGKREKYKETVTQILVYLGIILTMDLIIKFVYG